MNETRTKLNVIFDEILGKHGQNNRFAPLLPFFEVTMNLLNSSTIQLILSISC